MAEQSSNVSRAARQGRITTILESTMVHSQSELSEILLKEGIEITQATLSRDLDELGAKKIRTGKGRAHYVIGTPGAPVADFSAGTREKLRKMLEDLVISIDWSRDIAVLRTPPGAAQYLASFIDRVGMHEVVGCIAGDDTVFVLAREPLTGKELGRILTHSPSN